MINATREAGKKLKLNLKGASVAVQGFGNVGMHFARLMHDEQGSKIVAVTDSKGGIFSEKGFDPKEVLAFKEKDRKSTRLNSSHLGISYAVFCLKKKKTGYTHCRVRRCT